MEENQVEGVEQTEAAPAAPQYSEVELKALEMGWRPKEEWTGPEEEFVDAKEFVGRQPLFERVQRANDRVRSLENALNSFRQHHSKVEQAAYQRALRDLQDKQKVAIKEGDLEQYHNLAEEINEIKEQAQEVQQIAEVPAEPPPEYTSWRKRNSWYGSDVGMTDFADKTAKRLHSQGMEPLEVLKAVEARVRETYVHKFKNPNANRPGAVESGAAPAKKGTGSEDYPLSDVERKIMNDLVRTKQMTKAEYIAELKKVKEKK